MSEESEDFFARAAQMAGTASDVSSDFALPEEIPALSRRRRVKLLADAALELVFPRRCPFCDEVLGWKAECEDCAPELETLMLNPKRLSPGTHYFGELSGAAAVFHYRGCVRSAILRMKYEGCRWYGRDLGNRMAKTMFGCTFFRKYGILLPKRALWGATGYDVVVPVPKSGRGRGYNVPLLLAEPIAAALGLPIQAEALVRVRHTRHQAGLPLEERLANVAGAFRAGPRCDVEGRRVLLVDDVITTGATAAACTAALLAAGAENVFAVGLASSQWQDDTLNDKT
jgi:ComF family protein